MKKKWISVGFSRFQTHKTAKINGVQTLVWMDGLHKSIIFIVFIVFINKGFDMKNK
jgi:hypothetical protein